MAQKPRYRIGSDGSNPRAVVGDNSGMRPTSSSEYMRGQYGPNATPFFFNWHPALRDSREDVISGYVAAAARAIDAMQNSGWLSGAVDQAVASTLGTGLRLVSRPDAKALGWTTDVANGWARDVERRWETWSCTPVECDASGKQTVGEMTATVMKQFFSHGEGLALLPLLKRSGVVSRTKVKLLQPHKLTQRTDGFRTFQGVQMDNWGFPVAYHLMLRNNIGGGMLGEWETPVQARDGAGRQQVVHVFRGEADQVRGITPLAPVLKVLRQYDQLSDATLQKALLHAIFAATVQSEAPTNDVLQALQDEDEQSGRAQGVGPGSIADYLGAKAGWYENTKIDFGRAGKIAHLFPGEELTFHTNAAADNSYEAFAKFLLREIARCLGLTFETLTGDYTGATYSSVRMATSELWPIILNRRTNIGGRFCQAIFEAWLEEEIENGRIEYPGGFYAFVNNRLAASRADWRGPAKPQADDLKSQKAHEGYKRMGVITDEMICADMGQDWENVYEQRAHEMKRRKELGLPEGDTLAPEDPVADALITDDRPSKKKEDAEA